MPPMSRIGKTNSFHHAGFQPIKIPLVHFAAVERWFHLHRLLHAVHVYQRPCSAKEHSRTVCVLVNINDWHNEYIRASGMRHSR